MKRNNKLLAALNSLLVEKLTTINQLMVYSEMCENLGYSNLHKAIQKQAMDQMLLAEWLMERIRFCEGSAPLSKLNRIMIDKTVSELIEKYETDELEALQSYSNAIELAAQVNDNETVEVLSKILMKEKGHASWAQNQRAEIENKGMEKYLLNHLGRLVN
jgi:bacterioferritin